MNEWEWQLLEDKAGLDRLTIAGVEVKVGSRVRLRPRHGGDVLDIALAGQVAIIESIEQDYEGKNHVCVVMDDDPGRDWACSASRDTVSSSMRKKSNPCRARKLRRNLRPELQHPGGGHRKYLSRR